MSKISIIGSGHVAYHIGMALYEAGHVIVQVIARNKIRGIGLAQVLSAQYIDDFSECRYADIYIIAVSDDAIIKINKELLKNIGEKPIVVHTSGSVSLKALSQHHKSGVMWPLQSIRRERKLDWTHVPIIITTSENKVFDELEALWNDISNRVIAIKTLRRLWWKVLVEIH